MPNRGQENLQNLRMKGRVSKDRFLVSGLGRQGLSSFQFAFPEENKSKIQTMFTKCACKPATFVYHYLWFHTAPSLEKSLPKGRTASTAIHLPATLWAAAGSWCGHTPLHSWLCTEEEKKKGFLVLPFDFKLSDDGGVTTAHLVLVHQMAPGPRHSCDVQEHSGMDALQHYASNGHPDLPRTESSNYHWPPAPNRPLQSLEVRPVS